MDQTRQKILIITYFYPPCNLTAANRVKSWATYFNRFGLYPVIVTRNWDVEIRSNTDILKPSGKEVQHEKYADHEVYYLPHKGTLRDKLFARFGGTKFSFITKPLTVLELFGQHFFSFFTPFLYLYSFSKKYLQQNPDVSNLLVSGNPFILFKFGYKLKKMFPRIRWFADYRDDWSTSEINDTRGFLKKMVSRTEARSEKKWVSTAGFICSVSPWYTEKIARFTGRPGYTIYNGYQETDSGTIVPVKEEFIILYNGTLYPTQPVEDFFEVMEQLVTELPQVKFRVLFPGLGFDPVQADRVRKLSQGLRLQTDILPRIPREEVINMQLGSHVLLMFAHTGKKGIPSSKIFEYMSMGRPIVVYPNDHDVLEKLIDETKTGKVGSDKNELKLILTGLVEEFLQELSFRNSPDTTAVQKYSRENQARYLAELIRTGK